jgi:4a-hydroxytetrahydrobiopterin dehydratase
MTKRITADDFSSADGVSDWRALSTGACAYFKISSFPQGVELITKVAELAEAANHHPDIDFRYGRVIIRLMTHSENSLTDKDLDLARQISAVARELGVVSDPSKAIWPGGD